MALPIDARSPATARKLLLAALHGREDPAVDDALLMISELVTNAVRHTRTVLLVLVTIENHTLHVDVTDDNPTLPMLPDPEHDAHAWWPADPAAWPGEAHASLRAMAAMLGTGG